MNHISKAWAALRLERNTAGVRKVADRIEDELKDAARMYLAAAAVANMPLAIKAKQLLKSHLELLAKITGELDERPQVTVLNIQQSAEWLQVREVVLAFIPRADHMRFAQQLRLLEGGKS